MEETKAILGIETSCDETAAALVTRDGLVKASVLDSQVGVHARFGGVVPELASRRHLEQIETLVQMAMDQAGCTWSDLAAIAVTRGPGLAGALLVGVNFGKALAYASGVPLIPVNHLKGHLASAWLARPDFPRPAVLFVVSGGHTHLYYTEKPGHYELLGKTLDDAAGEAFDKGAKMLGLGYPGGPALDRLARTGSCTAVRFPRPFLKRSSLDVSFSGLKTALLYYLRDRQRGTTTPSRADIAASYQEAIVDVLVEKAFRAVRRYSVNALAVVGGVAANSRLRARFAERAEREKLVLVVPPLHLCTDNAAMIAAAGWEEYRLGRTASWDLDVAPNWANLGGERNRAEGPGLSCSMHIK